MQVLGNFRRCGKYYPGTLFAVNGGQCTIKYDDGDEEKDVSTGQVLFLPMHTTATELSEGTCVLVRRATEDPAQHFYEVGTVKGKQRGDIAVELIDERGNIVVLPYPRQQLTVGGVG